VCRIKELKKDQGPTKGCKATRIIITIKYVYQTKILRAEPLKPESISPQVENAIENMKNINHHLLTELR
jgi:hypothetical protein